MAQANVNSSSARSRLPFRSVPSAFDGLLEAVFRQRVFARLRDGLRANDAGENFLHVAMCDRIRCVRVFMRLGDRDHAPADRRDSLCFGDRRKVGADDRRIRRQRECPDAPAICGEVAEVGRVCFPGRALALLAFAKSRARPTASASSVERAASVGLASIFCLDIFATRERIRGRIHWHDAKQ
jgi:hypothetical protein